MYTLKICHLNWFIEILIGQYLGRKYCQDNKTEFWERQSQKSYQEMQRKQGMMGVT